MIIKNKINILFSLTTLLVFAFAQDVTAQEQPSLLKEQFSIETKDDASIVDQVLDDIEQKTQNLEDFSRGSADRGENAQTIILDEIEVKEMPIKDVLNLIASKSGLKIITEEEISERITIYLKEVDVMDALRIILDTNGLAFSREGETIRVLSAEKFEKLFGYAFGQKVQTKLIRLQNTAPSDLINLLNKMTSDSGKIISHDQNSTLILIDNQENVESMFELVRKLDVPKRTQEFELLYVRAEDIAKNIQEITTKNVGRVEYDEKTNKLIVTDLESNMKNIAELVKKVDQKEKGVLLEIKTIQILLNEEHLKGVDWEAIVSNYQSVKILPELVKDEVQSDRISIGTVSGEDFEILLDALDTVGAINTISNNQVKIDKGEKSEFVVRSLEFSKESASDPDSDIVALNNKTRFNLVPRAEGEVFTIDIQSEMISIPDDSEENEGDQEEALKKRIDFTEIEVQNESTIVMGGLFKEVTIESTRKIPLLGDLPILGFAFRREGKSKQKSEIIVFITPKLVEIE